MWTVRKVHRGVRYARSSRGGTHPNTATGSRQGRGCHRSARIHHSGRSIANQYAGVWALGDCNGRGAFTLPHDYEIVADNLFNEDHRRVSDRIQAYALYLDPPLGRCGMTDAEIRKSGRQALIAQYPMSRVSRAYEKGETQGFMKICVDAETKQILGAAILGTGGDEVIHVLLDVMYAKAPYTVIQRAMHIHPTVAEYLPTVLAKLEPFAWEKRRWTLPFWLPARRAASGGVGRHRHDCC